ncbi:MAG: hypothetical protein KAX44_05250, partial [Candidatus Brocadiae bacterium]|nr:hypothetical protein [Candidatus Brocadiia bacterium]
MNGNNKRGELPLGKKRPSLEVERLESRILLSAPVIQSLEDSPDPVNEGGTLTLTAHTVVDQDGAGQIVEV